MSNMYIVTQHFGTSYKLKEIETFPLNKQIQLFGWYN